MQNYETIHLFHGHTVVYSTLCLFHLYLFHGHTTQFGDQLMERLLDAIMWSGYVGRGCTLVHIICIEYKVNPVRSFSCEDASGTIELEGKGQRQRSWLDSHQ